MIRKAAVSIMIFLFIGINISPIIGSHHLESIKIIEDNCEIIKDDNILGDTNITLWIFNGKNVEERIVQLSRENALQFKSDYENANSLVEKRKILERNCNLELEETNYGNSKNCFNLGLSTSQGLAFFGIIFGAFSNLVINIGLPLVPRIFYYFLLIKSSGPSSVLCSVLGIFLPVFVQSNSGINSLILGFAGIVAMIPFVSPNGYIFGICLFAGFSAL
jgi:hypothetical protein